MARRTRETGETTLPPELGERVRALLDIGAAPATMEEFLGALVARGFVPSPEQLCAARASRHRLRIGNRTLYMNCVLDALVLPLLEGESGEIASESPASGAMVTARVSRKGIAFDPSGAVVSFGVARDAQVNGIDALCPYINAFASAAEYETWVARTSEAVSVMIPLARAYALARDFAERASEAQGMTSPAHELG